MNGVMVNMEPWAQSRAPGASFRNVAVEVGASTITQSEKAALQAAEDKIGEFTKVWLQRSDPKTWSDRVEAARAIPDPQKMADALNQIEVEKAGVPNVLAELDLQIVAEIKRMYPCAIKLLEAVIKRLDKELANIKGDQIRQDAFWGLQTVDSNNWLVFGIQRLRSGLESNLNSLRTNDRNQVSITRYVLSEANVLQPRAKVQSP
jgi:hypothetical protein